MTSTFVLKQPGTASGKMQNTNAVALFAAGAALWLLNHPYVGIWHDARVYTLLALHWLNPASFATDPWFQDNSADGLSLFAPLYGMVIRVLGVSDGAILMVLAGAAAWLAATFWLCVAWFERRVASFIFLALSAVSLTYCLGRPLLVLSESFATARLLSIPFSIAGLVAATQGRFWLGFILQLMGMMFHPLMSLWGLLAVILLRLSDRLVFALVVLGAGVVVVLYLNPIDIPIFREMDHEWQDIVRSTARIVFLEEWPKLAINDALWWFSALLFAGRFGQAGIRRTYQLVCLVCTAALLVSLVTSYFIPVIFLLQAQLWRALWLAVLIGFVATLDIGWVAISSGAIGRGMAALLVLTFLFRDLGGGLVLFLVFCGWMLTSGILSGFVASNPKKATRVVWTLVTIAIAIAACLPDSLLVAWIIGGMGKTNVMVLLEHLFVEAKELSFYTLIPFVVWLFLMKYGEVRRFRWGIALGAGLLLSSAAMHWDRRPPAKQQMESRYRDGGNRDMFAGLVAPGQQVYWQGNALRVWFEMGTASYVSSVQAIGIVFSRKRMTEVRYRLERLLLIEQQPRLDSFTHETAMQSLTKDGKLNLNPLDLHSYERSSPITKSGLLALCRDPNLSFVVNDVFLPDWPVSQYSETLRNRNVTYFLYDCGKLRARG